MKLFVGGSSPLVIDVTFDSGRDIGLAHFSRQDVDLWRTRCCCWRDLYCRLPKRQRVLQLPDNKKRQNRHEE
jgi:hypothetical protein